MKAKLHYETPLVRALRDNVNGGEAVYLDAMEGAPVLIGVRAGVLDKGALPHFADSFNDYVGVMYRDDWGLWHEHLYPATTDPGPRYFDAPVNSKGTFVMAPGVYREAYVLGSHKGQEALVHQGKGAVKGWRVVKDSTPRRRVLSPGTDVPQVFEGWFGTNIHTTSRDPTRGGPDNIGGWSAGCQVLQHPAHLAALLTTIKAQATTKTLQEGLTYVLLVEGDLL